MKKIEQIVNKILDILYPQKCGICGKINEKSLCKKCEIILNKHLENNEIKDDEEKYFEELIYIFKYEGLIRKMILDYKFNNKPYLSKTFVNFILNNEKIFKKIEKYDRIIPVPISKQRQKSRGYNQSLLIANLISQKTNLILLNKCLVKTKNIIEQSKLNKEERQKNIQGVYELKNKNYIKDKKILLIDDIYTTGSTVKECCKTILKGNPEKIGILVLARD